MLKIFSTFASFISLSLFFFFFPHFSELHLAYAWTHRRTHAHTYYVRAWVHANTPMKIAAIFFFLSF